MRALSKRQALNCEMACGPRCRCRCGGELHGAKRQMADRSTDQEFFESLPADDPHHIPKKKKRVQVNPKSRLDQLELFVRNGINAQRAIDALLPSGERP